MRILSALSVLCALLGLGCERAERPPVIKTKSGIEMVLIPAGGFEMGSARGKADEAPVHRVWVDAFLMDRTEVTQAQYSALLVANPSHFRSPDRPAEQITRGKAAEYCNARSRAEGLEPCYDEATGECNFAASGYRLPTEAEWEYACRAGTSSEYSFGRDPGRLGEYAWSAANSGKATHPVGQKKANPWGLFDMLGNVAEWCNDVYGEEYYRAGPERNPRGPAEGERYVLRGGAWDSNAEGCRSAARIAESGAFRDACFALDAIGFRCVRTAPANAAK